jgi:ureidoglycolate hydrolase
MDYFDIPVEVLAADAFADFGEVVTHGIGAPKYSGADLQSWPIALDHDGPLEMMLIRYAYVEPRLTLLERHFHVSQAFFPMGGIGSIMVVAPASESQNAPEPKAVRAFYMDGGAGVVLKCGTWHALSRFPVVPPAIDMVFVTDSVTQSELERQNSDGTKPQRTEVTDMAARFGVTLRLTDPGGRLGLPPAFQSEGMG